MRVRVFASSDALRTALGRQLREAGEVQLLFERPSSEPRAEDDLLVVPVADCPPEFCAELASRGVKVVLLAPVPRESERRLYEAAGAAAYLPMTVDHGQLLSVVSTLNGSS